MVYSVVLLVCSVCRSWSWSGLFATLGLPLAIDRQSELIVYHLVIVQSAYKAAAGTGVTVAELVVRKGERRREAEAVADENF